MHTEYIDLRLRAEEVGTAIAVLLRFSRAVDGSDHPAEASMDGGVATAEVNFLFAGAGWSAVATASIALIGEAVLIEQGKQPEIMQSTPLKFPRSVDGGELCLVSKI